MRTLCLAIVFAIIFGAILFAPPVAAFAQPTETIEVGIAGGQKITAKITARGVLPTEDSRIKIEVAGMIVGPSPKNSREPELLWNFSFRSKTNHNVLAVIVEDVTFDPVKTMVSDLEPVLRKDAWSGFAEPIAVTKEALPWLFDERTTMRVFRFIVRYDDDQRSILHQLAMYPAGAKEAILSLANKLRAGR